MEQRIYKNPQGQSKVTSFGGHFAAPIEAIHFQPTKFYNSEALLREMDEKCSKFFAIKAQLADDIVDVKDLEYKNGKIKNVENDYDQWGQDNKIIFDRNTVIIPKRFHAYTLPIAYKFAQLAKMRVKKVAIWLDGGNCFVGKNFDGDNFVLLGKNALKETDESKIALEFNIKTENVHIISQPNAHLDMAIRPLNYPYICVGDPYLVPRALREQHISEDKITQVEEILQDDRRKYIFYKSTYARPNQTVQELEINGFKTIKIPCLGNLHSNHMNAFVHQLDDGGLIYITNKSPLSNELGINFDAVFENYLKKEVPSVKEVIFIDGDGRIADSINYEGVGIHCMGAEKVNSEKLVELLKKN